jgi:RNase adaptor protein for sRNA GlmZ degradation
LMDQVDENQLITDCRVVVGINCELGRHRSLTFVNELARRLKEELGTETSWDIRVRHRDLERRSSKR